MSQEPIAQRSSSYKTFEEKSDRTFLISLAIGFAVLGGLGFAQWASSASNASKPAVSVQADKKSAEPVYRCADGRVSFTPCS